MGFLGPNTLSNYNVFDRLAGPSEATAERPDDYRASPRGRIREAKAPAMEGGTLNSEGRQKKHMFLDVIVVRFVGWMFQVLYMFLLLYFMFKLRNPRKVKA